MQCDVLYSQVYAIEVGREDHVLLVLLILVGKSVSHHNLAEN